MATGVDRIDDTGSSLGAVSPLEEVVSLRAPVRESAVAMARAALPNEACGVLAGSLGPEVGRPAVVIEAIRRVANRLDSPTRFELDGAGMVNAEDSIAAEGLEVVGVFHSHPAREARPSARDVADALVFDPRHRFVHLIASMQGFAPTVRAWRYGPDVESCSELVIEPVGGS